MSVIDPMTTSGEDTSPGSSGETENSVAFQYRLAHQRQVGPGYQNRDGLIIPKDLRPINEPVGMYKRFRDPRTGRVFAVDLLNHWYVAKNDSADYWLIEDHNSAGQPSRAKMKWCKVSELPRSLFSQGFIDFRQIFGTDEYMRPFLRLCENDNGNRVLVYPYDAFGNPVFPVCPLKMANMGEGGKYRPCPNHKFYGDGHYCLANDHEGRPIFPPNKSGQPVVPVTKDGLYPIYPYDLFGMGVVFPVDCMGMPIMAVGTDGQQRPAKNPFGHITLPVSLSSNSALVSLQRDGSYLNNRDVLRVQWLQIKNEEIQRKVSNIPRPIFNDIAIPSFDRPPPNYHAPSWTNPFNVPGPHMNIPNSYR